MGAELGEVAQHLGHQHDDHDGSGCRHDQHAEPIENGGDDHAAAILGHRDRAHRLDAQDLRPGSSSSKASAACFLGSLIPMRPAHRSEQQRGEFASVRSTSHVAICLGATSLSAAPECAIFGSSNTVEDDDATCGTLQAMPTKRRRPKDHTTPLWVEPRLPQAPSLMGPLTKSRADVVAHRSQLKKYLENALQSAHRRDCDPPPPPWTDDEIATSIAKVVDMFVTGAARTKLMGREAGALATLDDAIVAYLRAVKELDRQCGTQYGSALREQVTLTRKAVKGELRNREGQPVLELLLGDRVRPNGTVPIAQEKIQWALAFGFGPRWCVALEAYVWAATSWDTDPLKTWWGGAVGSRSASLRWHQVYVAAGMIGSRARRPA